ncbi:MAG: 2-C-methyl-D-erythritol 4-phosphate cytidylyltransferase [Lachnospiraceae bacterium]|nr:2-C-methyl-D-erythritol 4-phosphate cytidylyltransferase [Lachnospiraceae bacterium]
MTTAIILAAGQGRRMGTSVPKQFLSVNGEPLIVRPLRVFAASPVIDQILLVTSEDYISYCREEIVQKYEIPKVKDVIAGGKERYDSVYRALLACEESDYVMVHDGARPFVTEEILQRCDEAMRAYDACAVGMPVKDTIKIADEDGFAEQTPDRSRVWMIQTPQAFSCKMLKAANDLLREQDAMNGVTDDAMIVERSGLAKVKLVEGSYSNIKITTPEDLRYLQD